MSEMKKYMDIPRIGHKSTLDYFGQAAAKNYDIRIGIKLDGANGQFEVNENKELIVYSRREKLNENNNLRGFYQYIVNKVDPTKIPSGYKIFGEWLVSHTVLYPENAYNHFYLFNIYDEKNQIYINPNSDIYKNIASYLVDELGMKSEIVLYEGPYKGMDHIHNVLNEITKSKIEYINQKPKTMDEVFHEGIVIKSFDYRDNYGHQLFVKYVGERFQEIKKVNKPKKEKGADNSVERQIADFAATEARIEKIINKLIDEGVLPLDLELEHMNLIAKNVPKRVYEDIIKEEMDTIRNEFGEFDEKLIGKKINSNVMKCARNIVSRRLEERVKTTFS